MVSETSATPEITTKGKCEIVVNSNINLLEMFHVHLMLIMLIQKYFTSQMGVDLKIIRDGNLI